MSEDTVVLAQLEVQDCIAELYLNGIPVMRLAPPKLPIQNVAVEQLLVPGENLLEVVVEPGSHPSVARTEARELAFRPMEAVGRLIRFVEGAPGTVENGELLGEARFAWLDASIDRQVFPKIVADRIGMGSAHGRFAWQDAPVLTLDEATTAEARAALDEVEVAIRAGDVDRVWRLTELQIRDVLRAYPALDEATMRKELVTLIEHQQKAADPVIARDPAQHDFRLVAGGRMIHCVDRDYTTSFKLREPTDGSALSYPIFLARIDGALRIVR